MAMIVDMYSLPMNTFADICEVCKASDGRDNVDKFFQTEYGAMPVQGTWDQWQYIFYDKEQYVRFYLKWL